jgi:hypothetical protein
MMKQRFRPASLIPAGLVVDGIAIEGDRVVVRAGPPSDPVHALTAGHSRSGSRAGISGGQRICR